MRRSAFTKWLVRGVRLDWRNSVGARPHSHRCAKNLVDALLLSAQRVRSLTPSSRATAIARGVIAGGEELGTRVIATGVDSLEQRDILSELGCLFGMGEALAPAMAAEHLPPWPGGRFDVATRRIDQLARRRR